MRKLIGLLLLLMTMLMASCGGGGGYAGDTGPTNILRMSPLVTSVTLPVGYFADVATISQGESPYHVSSSDPSVGAKLLADGTLRVTGYAPGSSTVSVQDSSVKQTTISLTVTSRGVAMSSSVGGAISLALGESRTITISGGIGPFTASFDNHSVATVIANGNTFVVTGQGGGTANLLVTDATGATLTVAVTVVVPELVKLQVSPASATGMEGDTVVLRLFGGVAPYSVVSSNPGVATAALSGDNVTVSLRTAGTSTISMFDSSNPKQMVAATVTVTAPPVVPPPPAPTPTLSVVPPRVDVSETGTSPVTFMLINGTAPYIASVSSADAAYVTSANITGTTLTVNRPTSAVCVASDRNVAVKVYDAKGASYDAVMVIKNTDPAPCP